MANSNNHILMKVFYYNVLLNGLHLYFLTGSFNICTILLTSYLVLLMFIYLFI